MISSTSKYSKDKVLAASLYYLGKALWNESLTTKAGVDRHYKNKVDHVDVRQNHTNISGWIDS